MIDSIKPLGNLVNRKREKEKTFKPVKKAQGFAKYLERVVADSNKESSKK